MNLHFLLCLAAGLSNWANATSFYIRPLPEFARDARYIVRGTLHSIHSEYGSDPSGLKTLYTYAKLEVREVLKGTLPEREILIRKTGGTKDGVTLSIDSSPDFHENEETVLFLSAQKDDLSYEVEGLELGKFSLEDRNGEPFLRGGLLAYSQTRLQGGSEASGPGIAVNQREWPLRELRKVLGAPPIPERTEIANPASLSPPPGSATEGTSPNAPPASAPSTNGAPLPGASDAMPPSKDPAKVAGLLLVGAGLVLVVLFLYLRRR
jgi:hypothetical protein